MKIVVLLCANDTHAYKDIKKHQNWWIKFKIPCKNLTNGEKKGIEEVAYSPVLLVWKD